MTLILSRDTAAFIAGEEDHYIDHLSPLCALFKIPLYVVSKEIFEQVKRFYPQVNVILGTFDQELRDMHLTKKVLFSCYSSLLVDRMFFYCHLSSSYQPKYVWCPHGNSEKGFNGYFENLLKEESYILCYGPKVEHQLLKAKLDTKPVRIALGNYRLYYYQQEKEHFDQLLKETCPYFFTPQKKILYAPTWGSHLSDKEFKQSLAELFSICPSSVSLIVKLHPNILKRYATTISHLKEEYSRSHLHFLEKFPPIYPLLFYMDAYVGDHSSILFDALSVEKPLFLIDEEAPFALTMASTNLQSLFTQINDAQIDQARVKQAYKEAFYSPFSPHQLEKQLCQELQSLEDVSFCNDRNEGIIVT